VKSTVNSISDNLDLFNAILEINKFKQQLQVLRANSLNLDEFDKQMEKRAKVGGV
jgi:hypothetical protein